MIYPAKIPWLIQRFLPHLLWRMPTTDQKKLYLTFDDGPIPQITPWILDQLAQYNAKATFFCVGDNIQKNRTIFEQIKQEGHQVGNHTFHHLKGWDHPVDEYLANVNACQQLTKTNLFRPPYGSLTPKITKQLVHLGYKIVMWEVTTWDFEAKLTAADCTKKILSTAKNGSIILLHDNIKSWDRIRETLPAILAHYTKLGFSFDSIPATPLDD